MIKRRDFLIKCAVGTAALMTPLKWVAADSTVGNLSDDTFKPSKDSYQFLLHNSFRCVGGEDGAIKLELVEVREGPRAPGLEQFELVFEEGDSVSTKQLQTGLYRVYHPKTGLALIHLAPSNTVAGRYTTYFGLFA